MEPIISGTTGERKGRTIFITVMLVAFSAWYFYDGLVKYPQDNLTAARDALVPRPDALPPLDPNIDADTAKGVSDGAALDALIERLGAPGWRHGDECRWFGRGGQLRVAAPGGKVAEAEWIAGRYDTHDIQVQIWIGSIMGVLGLLMLGQLVRVLRTRVVLDPSGLRLGSRPPIPLSAMTKIDASRYKEKGWVTLHHHAGGRTRTTRLDCDVIDRFRPIIESICQGKGWACPLPPPRRQDDDVTD